MTTKYDKIIFKVNLSQIKPPFTYDSRTPRNKKNQELRKLLTLMLYQENKELRKSLKLIGYQDYQNLRRLLKWRIERV